MNTDIIAKADDLGPTALVAAASALAPDALRNRPQDALMVLMAGRELGFAPMQSLRLITVIKGKITLAADATVALVRKSGECVEWRCTETTATKATYVTKRKGDTEPTTLTWTIEQAQRAGLVSGTGWRSYPEAMLRARCAAALARIVYPDIVAGIYDPDELAVPLDSGRVETLRPVEAPKPEPVVQLLEEAPKVEQLPVSVDTRSGLTGELLGLGDDVPDYVETLLARDGLDIGTAPLGRLRGAVSYLTTSRGRTALAAWRAERDQAMDAEVTYETQGEG
jgi:hypothetical protein